MKKEYLQDYQRKEREDFNRFVHKIQSHGLDPDDRFPSLERLEIFHQPIVYSVGSTYRLDKQKIWSQIPLAGTLLIPLSAYNKNDLLMGCGFDANDIPNLIRLANEEGRVRFGLADPPEYFENLDHFDDIFTQLKPPELLYMPDETLSTDPQTIHKFRNEFEDLANVKYYDSLKRQIASRGSFLLNDFFSITHHRKDTFVYMKILGIEEEVDNISKLMITDPPHADTLLAAYEYLIAPMFDPLKASKNYSLSEIQEYDLNSLRSKIFSSSSQQNPDVNSFQVEIGRFIMKQIALNPSTYNACIEVIQHYEQNELYKVFEALDKAIKDKKQGEVTKHISELNEIMNKCWKDADKLKVVHEGIKDGISVVIGTVTGFASSSIGAEATLAAILASIGVRLWDKALSRIEEPIAGRVTRLMSNQYLANVYDFKHRHNL